MSHHARDSGVISRLAGKIVEYHPPGGLGVRASIPPSTMATPSHLSTIRLVGKLIVHGETGVNA